MKQEKFLLILLLSIITAFVRISIISIKLTKVEEPKFFASTKDELLNAVNNYNQNFYYLKYDYNKKGLDRFIVFATISQNSIVDSINTQILSDSVSCFYYSSYKEFTISYKFDANSDTTIIYSINNQLFNSDGQIAINKYKYHNLNQNFKPIFINSPDIEMNSFNVSSLTNNNPVDVILY
jgi:hypothetical protein